MQEAGQNIKAIRELKNFTQYYMASKLNMSVPNYSNIETGKTDLTIGRLQDIARVLEIDYHQILKLNPSRLLDAANSSWNMDPIHPQQAVSDELIRQIKMKDEQINRLIALIETKIA